MYLYSESKWEGQRKTAKNLRVTESRCTSAGGGAFSLGLVTTWALLFICGYAENRNRDALDPRRQGVRRQHVYVGADTRTRKHRERPRRAGDGRRAAARGRSPTGTHGAVPEQAKSRFGAQVRPGACPRTQPGPCRLPVLP